MKKFLNLLFVVGLSCLSSCNDGGTRHTVVWLNYDNSFLYRDNRIKDGQVPVYKGEEPTKPGEDGHGYTFIGWSPEVIPTYLDTIYVAQYAISYNLTVKSQDYQKGDALLVSGRGIVDEQIVVEAVPVGDCVFDGWYENNINLVSKETRYSFTMPAKNYSLSARFLTQEEKNSRDKSLGIVPVVDKTNNTITYGLYPQTNINDTSLIAALNSLEKPNSDDWVFYKDKYYVKTISDLSSTNTFFDNGDLIVNRAYYWFECRPIVWSILSENNGEYYLLSSLILEMRQYDLHHSYYYSSSIRGWLNSGFYNSAFALNNSHIQTTHVDNSPATTDSNNNPDAFNDTYDNVFMPSYKDYLNEEYGFSSSLDASETRCCKITDWARARGAMSYLSEETNQYYGSYYSRSPYGQDRGGVWYITGKGQLYSSYFVDFKYGVRPSITFKL